MKEPKSVRNAIRIAHNISDDSNQSRALVIIARSLFEQGMIEESIKITNNISNLKKKVDALSSIAKDIFVHGMVDESKSI